MNAGIKATVLTKADHINSRIDELVHVFLNTIQDENSISKKEFQDFVRSMHIIVTTELTEKGVERKWERQ